MGSGVGGQGRGSSNVVRLAKRHDEGSREMALLRVFDPVSIFHKQAGVSQEKRARRTDNISQILLSAMCCPVL